MEIFVVYWVGVALCFLTGLILLIIKAVQNKPLKPALRLIIISIILLIIGAGACAVILSNLSINH